MSSPRQIEANRLNAALSTGPKTEAGKQQSSKNAITHGLTSKLLRAAEVDELVAARFEAFSVGLPADSDLDRWYLQQLALESVRIEQAQAIEQTLRVEQSQRAATCWHIDRASDAADLFEKIAKRPEKTIHALVKTRHGCERVIQQWELLGSIPRSGKAWDLDQRGMVLDLLGVSYEARLIQDPCPETAEAQAALAHSEIARLRGRKHQSLDALDESRREAAVRGIIFPDRDLKLVRRYEAMSRRVFENAIRHLKSRTKSNETPKPVPDGPRDADIASLEVLVNELRAMEARAEALAPLPAEEKTFEPAPDSTPERKPGNRKARRAAAAAAKRRR